MAQRISRLAQTRILKLSADRAKKENRKLRRDNRKVREANKTLRQENRQVRKERREIGGENRELRCTIERIAEQNQLQLSNIWQLEERLQIAEGKLEDYRVAHPYPCVKKASMPSLANKHRSALVVYGD